VVIAGTTPGSVRREVTGMRHKSLRMVVLSACWLAAAGCAQPPVARYVYQDGHFGVIGIPVNTYMGPDDYRQQAEVLMARHFPEGYEIVRAEEVIEGERTLDLSKKTEIDSEPNLSALNQMIKLGKLARTKSIEEKDSVQIRECRIIYKKKEPGGRPGPFSAVASLTPEYYLDPNEPIRRQLVEAIALVKKEADKGRDKKKDADPETKRAAIHTSK
jgi:hypothetical protein